jgi:Icc-related predicted phosphoesterase
VLEPSFKLLLASDLHGSNAAFRKLVTLAVQLNVDTLVVAGDWSGKQSLLVLKQPNGSAIYVDLDGAERPLAPDQLSGQLEIWRDSGIYPVLVDGADASSISKFDSLARDVRALRLKQWLDYGQERTRAATTKVFAIPGNDDGPEIDDVLLNHSWVCDVDERVIRYREYQILGLGFSTPTPWKTPRELSEEEIASRLRKMASQVDDWSRTISIIHVPPYNSGIDLAPEIVGEDGSLPRETGRGNVSIGSRAVRSFIESQQPLAVLAGHCHGSRGLARIGSTICVNAGSQYHHGSLSACLLSFRKSKMLGHQFFLH